MHCSSPTVPPKASTQPDPEPVIVPEVEVIEEHKGLEARISRIERDRKAAIKAKQKERAYAQSVIDILQQEIENDPED